MGMILSGHSVIILGVNKAEGAMKILMNILPHALLMGFLALLFALWAYRFSVEKSREDSLSCQASAFRNNAFIGFADKDLEDSFGRPLQSEVLDHACEEDFFWWPSFFRDDTPWPKIKNGQKVRFQCFADGDSLLHVCEVLDSNGVWRVIGDVTPPKDVVF